MGLISGVKNMLNNALGTSTLKAQHAGIKEMAKSVLSVEKSTRTETFQEALARLNLTEADIERRELAFKRLSLVFSVFGGIIIIYMIYLVIIHSFFAVLGCFGILMIIAAQLFRYNFWLYQMQQRRLGCSVKEWFMNLISNVKR